jgi:hypothetical protein
MKIGAAGVLYGTSDGADEVETALEQSNPRVSLIRDARLQQEVCAAFPGKEAIAARDGA